VEALRGSELLEGHLGSYCQRVLQVTIGGTVTFKLMNPVRGIETPIG